jgi:flap endonuclease-1
MGIKNLKSILVNKCQTAIVQRKLSCYNGLIVGIDLSIFLYKYLYNNNDLIGGLTRLIIRLLKNNICPIFVFDGKPPKEKNEILAERKLKREYLYMKKDILSIIVENRNILDRTQLLNKMNEYIILKNNNFKLEEDKINLYLSDTFNIQEEIEKIDKKIIVVRSEHINQCKQLFDLFGVNYIHAPCEAESLLAVLCKKNIIDCCITEDMDILANGCQVFLKNFSSDKNIIDEYCLEGILINLEITYKQFVDLCILCGCDYTSKIYGIGHVNAYKLIKKYNNIEGILENIENMPKYKVPEDFDYKAARRLFFEPFDYEIIKTYIHDIEMKKPNVNELLNMLNETKLHKKYIKEIEESLMTYYLNIQNVRNLTIEQIKNPKKKQPLISSYFM